MKKTKVSLERVWYRLSKYFTQMGQKTVYGAMLMFYAYRRRETPTWARNIIIGAFGYLITPLDAIPDLTPILGFTDDLGVLSFGLVTIASYVNDEVRISARKSVKRLFGELDFASIKAVDAKL